jgi:hypothetical protein
VPKRSRQSSTRSNAGGCHEADTGAAPPGSGGCRRPLFAAHRKRAWRQFGCCPPSRGSI